MTPTLAQRLNVDYAGLRFAHRLGSNLVHSREQADAVRTQGALAASRMAYKIVTEFSGYQNFNALEKIAMYLGAYEAFGFRFRFVV